MTSTFGHRLAPLNLTVRELTGDMQLSKNELEQTQVTSVLSYFLVPVCIVFHLSSSFALHAFFFTFASVVNICDFL